MLQKAIAKAIAFYYKQNFKKLIKHLDFYF